MGRAVVREVRTITVNSTPGQVVGPNPGRLYLVVSPPAQPPALGVTPTTVMAQSRNLAIVGSAFSYIVPAGSLARLISWSLFTTATGVLVALKLTRSGIPVNIDQATGSHLALVGAPLSGGDRLDINVVTAVAGAVGDVMIAIDLIGAAPRVTLGLGVQPALDQGLTLTAGLAPFVLPGELAQGDIYAVADTDGRTVSVADVFLA